ncbi:hypothetical protein CS063_12000 [Sporanaerobium hydrogeniformans]|uniref:Uncharacterized protein n=1 Tax=Sporanaerobium hydrogeniformans TaxID=3072179 RepID=A0AC61DA11_9FIRM|nr:ATP-binding protein [Sporanaerobium hydrogeniformans]PHV70194.1 hypothetical protein CS063_12000 [Sporanaerobium hydrogeniformans]
MRTTIQIKIVMIYLSIILMIMMVSGTFIVYNIEERDYRSIQASLEQLAQEIEIRLNWQADNTVSSEDIRDKMSNIINENSFYLLKPNGQVEHATGVEWAVGDFVRSPVVIDAITNKKPSAEKRVPFSTTSLQKNYMDYASPILDAKTNELKAIIYVTASTKEVYNNMVSVMQTIGMGSLVAMVITGLFGISFSRMITSPIKKLTLNARKLAAGDDIKRIPIESKDEIGELTQSFNYMASQLSSTMETIINEKNKLEKIFEHMADGVMAFNRTGVLIHANSVCYELVGVLNMDHRFDFIFSKLGVEVSFDEIVEGKEPVKLEKLLQINDRYLTMHFAPYANAKEEAEGLVVVMQDVTKQEKLEQMRKEFVANVSHELRTPLTTLKSYTETLLDGAIDEKEVAMNFLDVMNKETDRMTTLVQDLLELSRIDNRQIQLNFKRVNLKRLLEDTIEAQKIHIKKKGHQLIYEVDEKQSYLLLGDGIRIKQILHNILSNAIKYSIDPGTIQIRLEAGKEIKLEIADTGIGIPQEDLGRIFERFYRVDKARSRKMGGTGLGLAIAKELVELHGGRIEMNSELGKGTSVSLYFKPFI